MLGSVRYSAASSKRLFSVSAKSQGFMEWFNHKKNQESKKKVEKPDDINNVISKAESNEITVNRLEKIEFIGQKTPKNHLLSKEERLNGFIIKPWLSKNKIQDKEEFKQLILSSYNQITGQQVSELKDAILDDLSLRFDLTKVLQSKSGYQIPDYILTKASTGQVLHDYFEQKLVNGEYLIKNKQILPIETLSFDSPNISIQNKVTSSERKQSFNKLLSGAKLAQKERAEQLIQESRT